MNEKLVCVKDSPLGQDFQDTLYEKLPLHTLDVAQSVVILKDYLIQNLSHGGSYTPDLKYLYPVYFDAARVLLAECVAEFFQTGMVHLTALDPYRMEYVEREIRQIMLTREDVFQLLRVLQKVRNPCHGLIARWENTTDEVRWMEHFRTLYEAISKLQ